MGAFQMYKNESIYLKHLVAYLHLKKLLCLVRILSGTDDSSSQQCVCCLAQFTVDTQGFSSRNAPLMDISGQRLDQKPFALKMYHPVYELYNGCIFLFAIFHLWFFNANSCLYIQSVKFVLKTNWLIYLK